MLPVRQRSNLGPLLFLFFINNLSALILSNKLLYADDIKILTNVEDNVGCFALQKQIINVYQWCLKNKLEVKSFEILYCILM